MPTISMFYGILISLLYEDNDRHHLPHFHARYQNLSVNGVLGLVKTFHDGPVDAGRRLKAHTVTLLMPLPLFLGLALLGLACSRRADAVGVGVSW
jgi:hypothetical protein